MIHKKFDGTTIYKPGIYWNIKVNMAYGIPVGEKKELNYVDAFCIDKLLTTLKRLDLIYGVSKDTDARKQNDNELYYTVTVWESLYVNQSRE